MSGSNRFSSLVLSLVKKRSAHFFPHTLTSHLKKACVENEMVKSHIFFIDEVAWDMHQLRITVKQREVNNTLLQATALKDIQSVSASTGKLDAESQHTLYPLDMVAALKEALLLSSTDQQRLGNSFETVEEYLVDQIVRVCAVPQGSGDWYAFVPLHRKIKDVNEPPELKHIFGDRASKSIAQLAVEEQLKKQEEVTSPPNCKSVKTNYERGDRFTDIVDSLRVDINPFEEEETPQQQEDEVTSLQNGKSEKTPYEADDKFAKTIESLLTEFGVPAFAAFLRLQQQNDHYRRIALPCSRESPSPER